MNYRINGITFEYQNDGHCLNNIRLDDCSKITSITILSNIKEIGKYAFCKYRNLESITIPTSVTKICSYAFENCYNLETLIIPPSVIEIEDKAFNPEVSLLILPQKFRSPFERFDRRMFIDAWYKSHTEYYDKRRRAFYYEDQKLIDYLDMTSNALSQLKQYCPFLNLIDNENKSSDKTLLQAYKNVSQKYPILFKEFEKEVLRLDPNFKFE